MRNRNTDSSDSPKGSPAWMVTYADTVTLLLAFFVLLFTFSTIDIQRFEQVIEAIQESMGVLHGGRTIAPDETMHTAPLDFRQLEDLYQQLQMSLDDMQVHDRVSLLMEERGLVIRFADQVLFDLGRADIKAEAQEILEKISPLLLRAPNPLRIEGHTDNLPINTPMFPSNWELSTHRATNVVRFLIEQQDFSPDRLSAAGYGEYHPIESNETAEGRSFNRRVDIVVLYLDADRTTGRQE